MKLVNVSDEYRKYKELKKDEVLKLLEWIKQQPHLPKITERECILFYFACNYSVEMTKRTIDNYYTIRTHCPQFFSNLNFMNNELKRAMNTLNIVPIKNKSTSDGYRVLIGGLNDPDPSKFDYAECMKAYTMLFDYWLLEDGIQPGYVLVMDMNGCTLGHVARLNPMNMKKYLTYLQEAAPIRLKGLHFINIVSFVDKVLAIMKPFMKQELINMLHLHSNLDDFYKFVPKDMLPIEYGGRNGTIESIKNEVYKEAMEDQQYFLDEEKSRRVNEKLRPGKPKNASDLFGAEGMFKKLDID